MSREEIIELLRGLISEVEQADQLPVFASSSPGMQDYSTGSATSLIASYDSGELRRLGIVRVGKDIT